jgi:uncharacterized protein DUF4292
MKKNISNSLFVNVLLAICFVFLMGSCKTRKQLVVNRTADSTAKQLTDINTKLNAIRAKQNSFNTFSGKAKTKLDIAGNSNDVTLNIRISSGQKIWISVTAIAGIEVARALITPDSILLINRFQSYYIKQPFSFIYAVAGRQVNYKTIESLFVGNAIPELLNSNSDLQTTDGNTTLTGNLQGMVYKLIVGPDMKVTQTDLSDPEAGQSMQVTNSAFTQVGSRVTPSQIDIVSVAKDKKIQLNLHYVKIDFDLPLEFPFSIPSKYKEGN